MGSEVAPAVEALGGVGSGELIERNALRPWVDNLDRRPVWNAKACSNPHAAALQLDNSSIEVWHTEQEDGPIAIQMPGEQYRGRLWVQANHRHSGPEGLNGENKLGAQPGGEVLDVGRDVTAWEIDELKPAKHNPQATSELARVLPDAWLRGNPELRRKRLNRHALDGCG